MKKLKKLYAGVKLRDKLLIGFVLLALGVTGALAAGQPALMLGAILLGFLLFIHLVLSKGTSLATVLVMAVQLVLLYPVFQMYALLSEAFLGSTSFEFSLVLVASSLYVYSWLLWKYSVGHLWISLLLTYFAVDLVGPAVMSFFGLGNAFIGVGIGLLVVIARSILWRNAIRRNKHEIPEEIKDEATTKAVLEIAKAVEGTSIEEINGVAVNFSVDANGKTYYVAPLALKERIAVIEGDVASGIYNLKSTLYVTADEARAFNAGRKRKDRKEAIPVIINSADKSQSMVELRVDLKGKKRGKGLNVLILSPASFAKLIRKKD